MIGDAHDTLRSRGQTRPALPLTGAVDLRRARAELETRRAGRRRGAAQRRAAWSRSSAPGSRSAPASRPLGDAADRGAGDGRRAKAAAFGAGSVAELQEAPAARYLDALAAFSAACRDARARPRARAPRRAPRPLRRRLRRGQARALGARLRRPRAARRATCSRGPPARGRGYAERFARIMVDEFQDTNPLQLELLGAARPRQRFIVGDELQSIYGFRHADVERLPRAARGARRARRRRASCATNFRARPEILELDQRGVRRRRTATRWVAAAPRAATSRPAAEPRVELLLTDAAAWAQRLGAGARRRPRRAAPGGPPRPRRGSSPSASRELVRRRRGARRATIVVLLRAATDIGLYERAIEQAGLATLATGGRGWWAPAGRRTSRLPRRAREPARRGRAARPARLAARRRLAPTRSRCWRWPPGERRGALWDARSPTRARRRAARRADHERLRAFRALVRRRARAGAAASASTSCSAASSSGPATTCTSLRLPGRRAADGERPQAPAAGRRVRGPPRAATCAAFIDLRDRRARGRRRASPTRRSTSATSRPCA